VTIYCIVETVHGMCKRGMIYTIKLCNKTIHNVRSEKNVCVQTIYCINDTIHHFLMTYLLLDTINFTRSRICLSGVDSCWPWVLVGRNVSSQRGRAVITVHYLKRRGMLNERRGLKED
jgi:hypothetical protein